jgi:hypothetical protein
LQAERQTLTGPEELPPEEGEVEAETRKVGMGERLARPEGTDELVGSLEATEALDSPGLRVHEPVVRDAERRVALGLSGPIVDGGRGREHLDDEQRSTFDPTVGNLRRVGDHDEVRLDDIVRGEDHVDGRDKHFGWWTKVLLQRSGESKDHSLMQRAWRRGHVDLPVKQLVALAVRGDGAVVIIVEPGFETGRHVLSTSMKYTSPGENPTWKNTGHSPPPPLLKESDSTNPGKRLDRSGLVIYKVIILVPF